MFLVNWFWDILATLGLAHKSGRILFLGLDNAGKTTLLQMMKDGRVAQYAPTLHPHSEELIVGKIRFKTFDLGGHEIARRVWKDYFAAIDAIIYMVDASDPTRFPESKEELVNLLECDEIRSVPVAVLGNKIDLPSATSEEDLRRCLSLHSTAMYGRDRRGSATSRPLELFMCSVIERSGYVDAFRWLSQFLN